MHYFEQYMKDRTTLSFIRKCLRNDVIDFPGDFTEAGQTHRKAVSFLC